MLDLPRRFPFFLENKANSLDLIITDGSSAPSNHGRFFRRTHSRLPSYRMEKSHLKSNGVEDERRLLRRLAALAR
jgi:hypothetical protein